MVGGKMVVSATCALSILIVARRRRRTQLRARQCSTHDPEYAVDNGKESNRKLRLTGKIALSASRMAAMSRNSTAPVFAENPHTVIQDRVVIAMVGLPARGKSYISKVSKWCV